MDEDVNKEYLQINIAFNDTSTFLLAKQLA